MSRYRHLEFSASSPAPTDKEIAAIESRLGAKLPHEFKAFLHAANGAYLDYWIEVPNAEGGESFYYTFSTRGDDEETFLGELEILTRQRQIPPGMLPFACARGGEAYVLLDLREGCNGAVVASLSAEAALVPIANSFAEYIERLRPLDFSDE